MSGEETQRLGRWHESARFLCIVLFLSALIYGLWIHNVPIALSSLIFFVVGKLNSDYFFKKFRERYVEDLIKQGFSKGEAERLFDAKYVD